MAELLNVEIAQRLREVAVLLHQQGANPFRVQAYRHAADTLQHLECPVTEIIHREGVAGLQKLPGIGESLSRAIMTLITVGRLPMLDRLRGESDPVALLASVPGIGASLATHLHDDLGIETLEELETAAHDGRLSEISGIGEKRLAGIIDSLAGRLNCVRERFGAKAPKVSPQEAPVAELLDVDRQYCENATAGVLRTIAPRRFNPTGEAWLPILHTERGPRHYTAMFSNTPRAHQFKKTRDWVILYFDDGTGERQCTMVTGLRGKCAGRRIVRGRESECTAYYQAQALRESAVTRR